MITAAKLPRKLKDRLRHLMVPPVSRRISSHFRPLPPGGRETIEASLRQHYFASGSGILETAEGQRLLEDHLFGRLEGFRRTSIPWLNEAGSLPGARVLEIGCGTGSSTVALAEQGARVTAIDIEDQSLEVARTRCQVYDVEARFLNVNATEVENILSGESFDSILFFAVLEHMTPEELITVMRSTWNMLPSGGLWCALDTPNRLWFYDGHTSLLPFYHWLPVDLAVEYAKYSPREVFNRRFTEVSEEARLQMYRQGRGVSFHEFTLAMGPVEGLTVAGCLPLYLRKHSLFRNLAWKLTAEARYEALLRQVGPKIHPAFYQPSLDLIIRKV